MRLNQKPRIMIIAAAPNAGFWGNGKEPKVLAPPLALPLLAGLTPNEYEITLVDENVEPTNLNADVDLVAISCMTASAPRAYQIADAFQERGITVIMGGIHPTVMPDEAGHHADAVVRGEAESVWERVLEDWAGGRLQSRYEGGYANMAGLPIPRRDLLRAADRYLTTNVVLTGRGCPNNCIFCSVGVINGRVYRPRPILEVVEEIKTMRGWVGFVDDNIMGHPKRDKALFEAMIPHRIPWVGQGDLSMAKDPELMKLAVRSGCQAMFIGFESLSQSNLVATSKRPNIDLDLGEAIRKIHKAGIEIVGSFILGLDDDDKDVFQRTVSFARSHGLAAAQFSVLTPFPGTKIREQLEAEGRIICSDWSRYTMSNVVFEPRNMTPEELSLGQKATYRDFYSIPSILQRSFTIRGRILTRLVVNWSYRSINYGGKGLKSNGLPT